MARATEEPKTRTDKARPWLRRALTVMGVAAAFATSCTAASSSASAAAHKRATHRHKKATSHPNAQTPVQGAATKTVRNLAAQIIADYNGAKGSQPYQGVAYIPEQAPSGPGEEGFSVEYPTGTNLVTNNGKTENIGTGWYKLYAVISYPRNDKNPPGEINLNNVSRIGIGESLGSSGLGPEYLFSARSEGAGNKQQWDLFQEVSLATGRDAWAYTTGHVAKGEGVPYTPLTTQELQVEAGEAQVFLNNAKQYVVTPITPALEARLPPPALHVPPPS